MRTVSLIFLFFLFSGCSVSITAPARDEAKRITSESLPATEFKKIDDQVFTDGGLAPVNFSSLLQTSDNYGNRLRYAMQYLAKGKVKIEVFPTTNFYQLASLTINDEVYRYRNSTENINRTGNVSDDTIEQVLGINLSIEQLLSLVLQKAPKSINDSDIYLMSEHDIHVHLQDSSFIGVFSYPNLSAQEFFYLKDNKVFAKVSYLSELPKCHAIVDIPKYDLKIEVVCSHFRTDKIIDPKTFEIR